MHMHWYKWVRVSKIVVVVYWLSKKSFLMDWMDWFQEFLDWFVKELHFNYRTQYGYNRYNRSIHGMSSISRVVWLNSISSNRFQYQKIIDLNLWISLSLYGFFPGLHGHAFRWRIRGATEWPETHDPAKWWGLGIWQLISIIFQLSVPSRRPRANSTPLFPPGKQKRLCS